MLTNSTANSEGLGSLGPNKESHDLPRCTPPNILGSTHPILPRISKIPEMWAIPNASVVLNLRPLFFSQRSQAWWLSLDCPKPFPIDSMDHDVDLWCVYEESSLPLDILLINHYVTVILTMLMAPWLKICMQYFLWWTSVDANERFRWHTNCKSTSRHRVPRGWVQYLRSSYLHWCLL